MIDIQRVQKAHDFVRSHKIEGVTLTRMNDILVQAYKSEFIPDDMENTLQFVEVQREISERGNGRDTTIN